MGISLFFFPIIFFICVTYHTIPDTRYLINARYMLEKNSIVLVKNYMYKKLHSRRSLVKTAIVL